MPGSPVVVAMQESLERLARERRQLLLKGQGASPRAIQLWEDMQLLSATLTGEVAWREELARRSKAA